MKLIHYYHIYAEGLWRPIVKDHLTALTTSGLAGVGEAEIRIGIVGHPDNREKVKAYLTESGVPYEVHSEAPIGWEQITLDRIDLSEDARILYCHTKGAAFQNSLSVPWRRSMTEGLVYRWRRAVTLLETGNPGQWIPVDAVGCYWLPYNGGPPRHFSGNFWWANTDYLRRLPRPVAASSRWDAEMWVGQGNGLMYDLAVGLPRPGNWLLPTNSPRRRTPKEKIYDYRV